MLTGTVLVLASLTAAVTAWVRLRGGARRAPVHSPPLLRPADPGALRAGDVFDVLGTSYWLSGGFELLAAGHVRVRAFLAPDAAHGDHWIATFDDEPDLWLLGTRDTDMARDGWPGDPYVRGDHRFEHRAGGPCVLRPVGAECGIPEARGRFAVLHALDRAILWVVPQDGPVLAIEGRRMPRAHFARMG